MPKVDLAPIEARAALKTHLSAAYTWVESGRRPSLELREQLLETVARVYELIESIPAETSKKS